MIPELNTVWRNPVSFRSHKHMFEWFQSSGTTQQQVWCVDWGLETKFFFTINLIFIHKIISLGANDSKTKYSVA